MKIKDILNLGGRGLLETYDNSFSRLISSIYPKYDWLPFRFPKVSQNYWDDINNQKKFLEWLKIELKIVEMEDWYNVGTEVLLRYFSS